MSNLKETIEDHTGIPIQKILVENIWESSEETVKQMNLHEGENLMVFTCDDEGFWEEYCKMPANKNRTPRSFVVALLKQNPSCEFVGEVSERLRKLFLDNLEGLEEERIIYEVHPNGSFDECCSFMKGDRCVLALLPRL